MYLIYVSYNYLFVQFMLMRFFIYFIVYSRHGAY